MFFIFADFIFKMDQSCRTTTAEEEKIQGQWMTNRVITINNKPVHRPSSLSSTRPIYYLGPVQKKCKFFFCRSKPVTYLLYIGDEEEEEKVMMMIRISVTSLMMITSCRKRAHFFLEEDRGRMSGNTGDKIDSFLIIIIRKK